MDALLMSAQVMDDLSNRRNNGNFVLNYSPLGSASYKFIPADDNASGHVFRPEAAVNMH